jgi:hypothetical protein
MLTFPPGLKIYLAVEPVDIPRQIQAQGIMKPSVSPSPLAGLALRDSPVPGPARPPASRLLRGGKTPLRSAPRSNLTLSSITLLS